MDKELDRLRRRPFLFPLLFPVLAFIALVAGAAWVFDARSTTVILAVRHAEVESQGTEVDPGLSPEGRERAVRLARMLAEIRPVRGIDAIFSSDARASSQTVLPVSEQLALPINSVSTATWNDLPKQILRRHRGEYVLATGNAASISALVKRLSGTAPVIRNDEYDAMFIIYVPQIAEPKVVRIRY